MIAQNILTQRMKFMERYLASPENREKHEALKSSPQSQLYSFHSHLHSILLTAV
jgi:hypothetical protein